MASLSAIGPVNFDSLSTLWVDGERSWWCVELSSLDYFCDRLNGVMVYREVQLQLLANDRNVDVFCSRDLRTFEDSKAGLPVAAPKSDLERGNVPVADPVVDAGAGCPTKEAGQAMWGVRPDALQQMRKVIDLLRDNRLPIGMCGWIVVIKHALFQIGPIADKQFIWRKDWQKTEKDSVQTLHDTIGAAIKTLTFGQSGHRRMICVSQVAAYFGQWHGSLRDLARECGRMALAWAKEIDESFILRTAQGCFQDEAQQALRADEYMCLGTAALSHSYGDLSDEDLKVLAIASSRMACCHALASQDSQRGGEVEEMRSSLATVLARRADALNQFQYAAVAARAALKERIGVGTWVLFENMANVWHLCEKSPSMNVHFHVCTLTGKVLRNGAPPGQLPVTILSSPTYLRSFAGFFFEVNPGNHESSYVARHLENGNLRYVFSAHSRVTIEEKLEEPAGEIRLHLKLLEIPPKSLPSRIRSATSAWSAPGEGVAVLRGKRYWDRNIQFLCLPSGDLCRIPPHIRGPDWRSIDWPRAFQRQLVTTGLSVGRRALSRFEALDFIHSYKIESTAKVEHLLPRYGLEFLEDEAGVTSVDWPGYFLCTDQEPPLNTLHGLTQFLLLTGKPNSTKVLVPDGKVVLSEGDRISITISSSAFEDNAKPWNDSPFLVYHEYNMHSRFKSLVSTSRAGRLQLAGLYTVSNLCLGIPDKLEKRNSVDVALEILRQVDFTSVLSSSENRSLEDILRSGRFAPRLWLHADEIQRRFNLLDALWGAHLNEKPTSWILRGAQADAQRPRDRAVAQSAVFHHSLRFGAGGSVRVPCTLQSVSIKSCELIEAVESRFATFVDIGKSLVAKSDKDWNIVGETDLARTALGKQLLGDMELSYQAHREQMFSCLDEKASMRSYNPTKDVLGVRDLIIALEREFEQLALQPGTSPYSALESAGGVHLAPTWRALMRAVCGETQEAWPNLDAVDKPLVVKASQTYARLCVLESRLEQIRICLNSGADEDDKLLRELTCVREWDCEQHPSWPAFEVERGIRIWPEQYSVAQALLGQTGNVLAQLNVGLGKSSVILPMLLLYYTSEGRNQQAARLHLLPTLIDETTDMLAESVGQCAVGCTLFVLPFSRSSARFEGVALVRELIDEMFRSSDAVLCTTPDWRLSHSLTIDQRGSKAGNCLSFVNILDESDQLLHYRYELVYALGTPTKLPNLIARLEAVQALLYLLFRPPQSDLSDSLCKLLQDEKLVVQASQVASGVRLCRDAPPDLIEKLQRALGETVLSQKYRPPIMKQEPIEPCPDWVLDLGIQNSSLSRVHPCLLAFRGLLAQGILVECLKAQQRVAYGIPRGAFARKGRNLAVPFRGANTPAPRADYVQPEVLLVYTQLSYYQDGLLRCDVIRAVQELLELGPTAEADEFNLWRLHIEAGSECRITSSRMFDLGNPTQLEEDIMPYFSKNRAVINFWLRVVVLPGETQQFSEQRSKSGWDLVSKNSRTIGFARTNDIKPLLPLSIRECNVMANVATNAMMVERIREHTAGVERCASSSLSTLVDCAAKHGCQALIDAGGLLAGVSVKEIVTALFQRNETVRAVTIFSIDKSMWIVSYRDGRTIPLRSSPTLESNTFAVFDQGRCRGADLRLLPNCCALLTLGAYITKAELMQSAGRMRGLGNAQKLFIAALPDVWRSLQSIGVPVTAAEVISFAQRNTIDSQRSGLQRWEVQGKQSTLSCPQPCKFELFDLYGEKLASEVPLSESADRRVKNLFAQIKSRREGFSRDFETMNTGADAECERELEQEKEKEQENERAIEIQTPCRETPILDDGKLCSTDWLTLSDAFAAYIPRFEDLVWPTTLYCTLNFVKPISGAGNLSSYQRSVDMVLVLPDRVVLITSKEAEQILGVENCLFDFAVANWQSIRRCSTAASTVRMARGTATDLIRSVLLEDANMMASVSLFACEGKIPSTAGLSSVLTRAVDKVSDLDRMFEFFKMRSKHKHFSLSDAEDALLWCMKQRGAKIPTTVFLNIKKCYKLILIICC